jgi:hypothetical protein
MLVPRDGGHGAAVATSISLAFETVLLFWIVRQRLGLHVLAFGKAGPGGPCIEALYRDWKISSLGIY